MAKPQVKRHLRQATDAYFVEGIFVPINHNRNRKIPDPGENWSWVVSWKL